jgi:protoporphyrinogen oxidase
VAGLATAHRLAHAAPDFDIVIFEKERDAGGLARSLTIAGIAADFGPHRINTQIPEIQSFLNTFLGGEMYAVHRKSQMYINGGYLDYPIRFSKTIGHFGLFATLRFGLSALLSAARAGAKDETASFEDLMIKAFGKAAYETFIRPYSEKVWKIPPDQIDAEVARVRVSAGGATKLLRQMWGKEADDDPSALKQFSYLPGGIRDLITKFEASFAARRSCFTDKPVRIEKEALVTNLIPLDDGTITVVCQQADGRERRETFDFCFSTIPVDDLVRMLAQTKPDDRASRIAADLRFLSMILVYLVANKPQISDNSWLYFPEKHLIFNRGYESKNFNPRWKSDKALICLEITCYRGDDLWNRHDADIAQQVAKEFCSTGMLRENEVESTVVARLTHAYPLLTRGYKQKLRVLWDYLSAFPTIISLGRQGLFQHNNMDHSLYMGLCAADLFLHSPSPAHDWYHSEITKFDHFKIID